MKKLIWLASYPKSGNTWLRFLLANYLHPADEPVEINSIGSFALGDSQRRDYERFLDLSSDPAALDDDAFIVQNRSKVLEALAGENAKARFIKSHVPNTQLQSIDLVPRSVTIGAIYIVRNPFDMVVSYADHYGMEVSTAAQAIGSPYNRVMGEASNVVQYLGSWSDHVTSWTQETAFPVISIRYEDLLTEPHKVFREVLTRIGMTVDEGRVDKAVRASSFSELSRQEESGGFVEKSHATHRFFRSGKSNVWQDVLKRTDRKMIQRDHGKVMEKLGYLS